MTNTNTFYSWNTKKTEAGFKWIVTENISKSTPNKNGSYVDTKILEFGVLPTRVRAKAQAIRWCNHFSAVARKAA